MQDYNDQTQAVNCLTYNQFSFCRKVANTTTPFLFAQSSIPMQIRLSSIEISIDLMGLRQVLLLTGMFISLEKYEPLFEDTSIGNFFKYDDALLVRPQ